MQYSDMNEELRNEAIEFCVTACEKFSTNNEVTLCLVPSKQSYIPSFHVFLKSLCNPYDHIEIYTYHTKPACSLLFWLWEVHFGASEGLVNSRYSTSYTLLYLL